MEISTQSSLRARIALQIGAALVLLGLLFAEFATFPANGHHVDTTKWPDEAQGILRERPGTPVSPEQWGRIDKALRAHGDIKYGQLPYWALTVRASWWWFLLLPVTAVFLLRLKSRLSILSALLVLAPSVAILLTGMLLTSAARA